MKKKVKLSKNLQEQILDKAIIQLRAKSQELQQQIENYYLAEVDAFYQEYSPMVYNRHSYADIYESGLGRTCNPVLIEKYTSKQVTFESGIEINTSRMHNDYNGTSTDVLNSFLAGYHGLPPYKDLKTGNMVYPPMISDLKPVEDTWYFVDKVLLKNMNFNIKI